ncbi:hypothetical protein H1W00_00545 [Aeromicrobium sp. Marseille-Q0843]|uniref:Uncharacterized protein n=1 Tax=Aeromicrobium phoceense TaxID=2754045 RepID=A0A838XAL7_9ACTN|nr:hypothetical protein [Aeromicrobium phoceense]MBA4606962.1 hypothetical protein [Aeromicrobium phoceense]
MSTTPPFDPNTNPKAAAKAAKAYAKATRPWFKKKRFIIPIAFVALAIAGSALSGGETEPTDEKPVAAAAETTTAAKTEKKPAAKKPAAKPKWRKVAELSGSADKQSDTIKLTGEKVRLSYEFKDTSGMDMVVGGIYLLDEGTDLMSDGGIPEVMISEAGKDSTILRKDKGEYFLKVTAANVEYKVVLEELK